MGILPKRPIRVRWTVRLRAYVSCALLVLAGGAIVGAARWWPDDFALNWGVDATGSRLGEILVFWALFGLLGIILIRRVRVPLRELDEIRHCAGYADEIELMILGVHPVNRNGRPTAAVRYVYQVVGTSERGEVLVRGDVRPLFTDAARS